MLNLILGGRCRKNQIHVTYPYPSIMFFFFPWESPWPFLENKRHTSIFHGNHGRKGRLGKDPCLLSLRLYFHIFFTCTTKIWLKCKFISNLLVSMDTMDPRMHETQLGNRHLLLPVRKRLKPVALHVGWYSTKGTLLEECGKGWRYHIKILEITWRVSPSASLNNTQWWKYLMKEVTIKGNY